MARNIVSEKGLARALDQMDGIRREAMSKFGLAPLDDAKRDKYLDLAVQIKHYLESPECRKTDIPPSEVMNLSELTLSPDFMNYDPSIDFYWRDVDPTFVEFLKFFTARITHRKDPDSRYHVFQARKCQKAEDSSEEKLMVYDTVLPFNPYIPENISPVLAEEALTDYLADTKGKEPDIFESNKFFQLMRITSESVKHKRVFRREAVGSFVAALGCIVGGLYCSATDRSALGYVFDAGAFLCIGNQWLTNHRFARKGKEGPVYSIGRKINEVLRKENDSTNFR